jgi:hypothetical protein
MMSIWFDAAIAKMKMAYSDLPGQRAQKQKYSRTCASFPLPLKLVCQDHKLPV